MELITATEAARRMGMQRNWVSRLCQQGRIPAAKKIGKIWIIPVGAQILPPPAPRKVPGPDMRLTRIPKTKRGK